ncbi:minor capsid scaffold protein [Alcelaphine gammaherpesvirus 1]|uniref:Capsid scaffolding protein n=1 Tax=Alcelaphine herpesvirus 1 (strain C500) TaxID=654901 RepID=SCAF_ALHV1|nr:minor capsid scaffold protein [Alcelaphine gammaherpesvirus 1]O36367.1 RecName: Full=Capsid scaffolding protein; AltName: Full=Capsid protein 17; AltName: Full=Protease precursor; Short=pPR; Contains: RecName: Full=Assemblin; AltName: Full=Protease; Contains: RecName: Full=Assembly protein; AltName: Full=Capsid assembly protein [Alcelaphine herpesvirus 1 strain C500]AAC58064.1 minor capsid scaffold protein [Alcelaphine gammaherpesvirus 1]APB09442.1 capsid maturation protease [Alcelaphine gamm
MSRDSLFVAGFVDISTCPKEDPSLNLDAQTWSRYLPLSTSIPLTVEHFSEAQVGWVTGLFSVAQGLFCTAVITAGEFLELLDSLYLECTVAQHSPKADLPRNPRAEVLHSWLPELSLSSVHPDLLGTKDEPGQVFHHISLCALGRRRGTVAVYGDSLAWVLSRFQSLSRDDVAMIATNALTPPSQAPEFTVKLGLLFAKAIDAGFISNRISTLKLDRQAAGISPATYLKASAVPQKLETAAPLNQPEGADTLIDSTMSGPGAPPAPQDDLIPVPRSAFLNMLESTVSRTHPANGDAPALLPFGRYNMVQVPKGLTPYVRPVGFIEPSDQDDYRYPSYTGPRPYDYFAPRQLCRNCCTSRPRKRAREDPEDEVSFPGEESTVFRKDLTDLSKSLAELQSEIRELKQMQNTPRPYPRPEHHYPAFDPLMYGLRPLPNPDKFPKEFICSDYFTKDESASKKPEVVHIPNPEQHVPACAAQPEVKLVEEKDVAPKQPRVVNASFQPKAETSKAATLQKLFCDEMLSKQ